MPRKSSNGQNIISEIKRVEKSLKLEIKKSLGLAFHKELKKTEKILRVEILKVEEKVEGVGEKVEGLEENLRKEIKEMRNDLMNKIDSFAGRTEALEEENTVGVNQTRELRVQVDDHEVRIKKIESTVSPS
mgnify:CR=1 FL=1